MEPASQAEFACRIGYQSQIIIILSGVEGEDVFSYFKPTYVKFRSLLTNFSQGTFLYPPKCPRFLLFSGGIEI